MSLIPLVYISVPVAGVTFAGSFAAGWVVRRLPLPNVVCALISLMAGLASLGIGIVVLIGRNPQIANFLIAAPLIVISAFVGSVVGTLASLLHREAPTYLLKHGYSELPIGMSLGLIVCPYIFAWLTLRKGYSKSARVMAFLWLAFVMMTPAKSLLNEARRITGDPTACPEGYPETDCWAKAALKKSRPDFCVDLGKKIKLGPAAEDCANKYAQLAENVSQCESLEAVNQSFAAIASACFARFPSDPPTLRRCDDAWTRGDTHRIVSLACWDEKRVNTRIPGTNLTPLFAILTDKQRAWGMPLSTFKSILRFKPNMALMIETGETPLHLIENLSNGWELASLFLDARANPNAADAKGKTPPMTWMERQQYLGDQPKTWKFMLAAGWRVNQVDSDGNSYLHWIARSHQAYSGANPYELVKRDIELLLAAGADLTLRNKAGQTAKEIAASRGIVGMFP